MAGADSAPAPLPPERAAAPLLLPALHATNGQTQWEKPCREGRVSQGSRAESTGCDEAQAAARPRPSAGAGETNKDVHLPGHSGHWNAAVQRAVL